MSDSAVILLVEDDPGDQRLTERALRKGHINHELHIVRDGAEALEYLHRTGRYAPPAKAPRPHLVLLDLNLPKVDGREVLENIRSSPDLRRMPVVILTTSQQEEDILRSYDLGVNSYISKPVTSENFMNVIQALEDYWLNFVILPKR